MYVVSGCLNAKSNGHAASYSTISFGIRGGYSFGWVERAAASRRRSFFICPRKDRGLTARGIGVPSTNTYYFQEEHAGISRHVGSADSGPELRETRARKFPPFFRPRLTKVGDRFPISRFLPRDARTTIETAIFFNIRQVSSCFLPFVRSRLAYFTFSLFCSFCPLLCFLFSLSRSSEKVYGFIFRFS